VNGGPAPRPACGGDAARCSTDGSNSDLRTDHRSAWSRYPYQSGLPSVEPGTPGTSCCSPAAGAPASFGGPSAGATHWGRSRSGMSRPPVGPATTSHTGHTTRGPVRGRQAARRCGLGCLGPSVRCSGAGPVVGPRLLRLAWAPVGLHVPMTAPRPFRGYFPAGQAHTEPKGVKPCVRRGRTCDRCTERRWDTNDCRQLHSSVRPPRGVSTSGLGRTGMSAAEARSRFSFHAFSKISTGHRPFPGTSSSRSCGTRAWVRTWQRKDCMPR